MLSKTKYNKTKDPASKHSVSYMHEVMSKRPIAIHPLLKQSIDDKEDALIQFKEKLSNFKPKHSALEMGIEKTKNQERIDEFKRTLDLQRVKTAEK